MKYIKQLYALFVGAIAIGILMLFAYILSFFEHGYVVIYVIIGALFCLLIGNMALDIAQDIKKARQKRRESK